MPVKEAKPAEVPLDIRALAEKPLTGPVPAGFTRPSSPAEIDALTEKVERSLASYSLAELELMPPDKALQILDLREKLERAKRLSSEREIEANGKIAMLQEIERNDADRRAGQAVCERIGHVGERGESAISGQSAGGGEFRLICQKCNKVYIGIGAEPGQLPTHIANRVNWDMVGRI